ncbi:MAG: hypothetical protein H6677_06095 [Candidatus Obscuribacterales bacterium]|nr:hypothetical protein [Cyanobacteria bacterium HKST-UBA01]MCB9467832.1 hypothetical protein [Candidatus Obscuribacterales bacterium]
MRKKTLYQDKEWLTDKYVKQKLSTVEIARIYREEEGQWCDPNTISRWLKKHGINMRSLAEAQQNRHSTDTTGKKGKRARTQ